MKKILLILIFAIFYGCNDGDFDISSFEFEEEVNVCGEYILYRLSENGQKEVLMVTLFEADITNSPDDINEYSISETGAFTVTDRVFNDEVTSSYFCQIVPPTEPKVNKDWRGVSGTIRVENKGIYDETDGTLLEIEHNVYLIDVVLMDGDKSLIFNDEYFFGTFETSSL